MSTSNSFVNKKTLSMFLILGLILSVIYYYSKTKIVSYETNTVNSVGVNRYEKMKKILLGQNITSLLQIMPVQKKYDKYIYIYLYMTSGCGNCMKKGFGFVNKIDSTFGKAFVKVICEGNDEVGIVKHFYDYSGYIYTDEREVLLQELKYIYTPVFLILDQQNKIIFVHFFSTSDDNNIINKLLDTVIVKFRNITH